MYKKQSKTKGNNSQKESNNKHNTTKHKKTTQTMDNKNYVKTKENN